ncbi:Glycosyltransferase involved in cell wall bisynthesis [Rhizobium sp. NFR07]|uniref:glycosyltransferase family 2 protein n=1 Tax=Rhizobium sp. NFR07 TaxID=1566262 RepID=UPI0008E93D98|nr:glycosyltransferase family A protein [Rhizobium sp. NFR07]SFB52113.1 Glycosyltransferase involved in cell wall bisynthesis [Rhizobium sp. NFR07]
MLHKFRRYPPQTLRDIPLIGPAVSRWYERLDFKGKLSDLIADPQIAYEALWPYRMIRRRFGRNFEPCVSVIIATRNNETTIKASINSMLRQTMPPLEVLVIDDASDDRSIEVIRAMAERDPRIKIVENHAQLGTGLSRNIGLSMARGQYIAFQDGDDVSVNSRLEMQFRALQRFPNKKLATCNYVRTNDAGRTIRLNDRRTMKCIISMMFPRAEVLEKVGYFRHESVSEDADYYERIRAAFGRDCEVVVFRTLYRALFRPSSSFFQTVSITRYDGTTLLFERRSDALDHWEAMTAEHKQMIIGAKSTYVQFRPSVGQSTATTK